MKIYKRIRNTKMFVLYELVDKDKLPDFCWKLYLFKDDPMSKYAKLELKGVEETNENNKH